MGMQKPKIKNIESQRRFVWVFYLVHKYTILSLFFCIIYIFLSPLFFWKWLTSQNVCRKWLCANWKEERVINDYIFSATAHPLAAMSKSMYPKAVMNRTMAPLALRYMTTGKRLYWSYTCHTKHQIFQPQHKSPVMIQSPLFYNPLKSTMIMPPA